MNLTDINLVIFDMDGLIFDTETIYIQKWIEIGNKYGYNVTNSFLMNIIGTNSYNAKQMYEKEFGINFPFETITKEIDVFIKDFSIKGKLQFMPGAKETITFLKQNNIKIAIASSSTRDKISLFLKNSNITDVFDCIISGDDVVNSKPNPEIFLKCSNYLNIIPQNTIVLEDSFNGIVAAKNANMIPIMIPDKLNPTNEIKSICFAIFNNLNDFINSIRK